MVENIEISENLEFALFFQEVADAIFNEVAADERSQSSWNLPGFDNLKCKKTYKEVSGNMIERENLNEAGITHEITRDKTIRSI